MPDRIRRVTVGAAALAILALALGSQSAVLGAEPATSRSNGIPTPREQHPGDVPGFRLPFTPGLEVRIDQGWNSTFSHRGRAAYAYDFGLYEGTPVLAAARGVVSFAHAGETECGGKELLRRTNYVTIDHADGSATHYGHLSTVGVKVGDVVAPGQQIGRSGKTGYTQCLPHLHFARQVQGAPVTASLPVYFEGYADREMRLNEIVVAPPVCPGLAAEVSGATAEDPPVGREAFCGTYYGGEFDGPAFFSRSEAGRGFDRTDEGPGGYWLDDPAGGYSVRWSGRFTLADWRYAFQVVASGRIRVAVDGVTIVDRWVDDGRLIETMVLRTLGAGAHLIEVEHVAGGGRDVLQIDWSPLFVDG